jgi:hypothetical protein
MPPSDSLKVFDPPVIRIRAHRFKGLSGCVHVLIVSLVTSLDSKKLRDLRVFHHMKIACRIGMRRLSVTGLVAIIIAYYTEKPAKNS